MIIILDNNIITMYNMLYKVIIIGGKGRMENIFLQYLQISLIAGLLILFLFLSAPLMNRHYAAKWKYWVWLFLAVWLLVPIKFSIQNAPIQVNVPYHLQDSPTSDFSIIQNNDEIKESAIEKGIEQGLSFDAVEV